MMDYSTWVSRAERFVRQLNYLPGDWGITIRVDRPISVEDAEQLSKSLPLGLPEPLRQFYTQGSGDLCCTYHWSPDDESLETVEEIFPSQYSIGGGPRIIPARELLDAHQVHRWHDQHDDWIPAQTLEIWRRSVPFIDVGNGDYLAFDTTATSTDMPVIYLSHDDGESPVTHVSPSFHHFIASWEALRYVGPEIWLLYSFLESGGDDPLNADPQKVKRWQEILDTCGR